MRRNRFDYTGKTTTNVNKKAPRAPIASTKRRNAKADSNLKMAMKNAETGGGNAYTWEKMRAGASRRMKPKAKPSR